jgi:PadR family transcriptional regulator, regulatory protein PadR
MSPKMTMQTRRVLEELLGGQELYGLNICDRTGLPGGTVYPILARLEQAGWVESRWEEPEQHEAQGRPRRRYYRLSTESAISARQAVDFTYRSGRKVWPRPGFEGGPA